MITKRFEIKKSELQHMRLEYQDTNVLNKVIEEWVLKKVDELGFNHTDKMFMWETIDSVIIEQYQLSLWDKIKQLWLLMKLWWGSNVITK